MRGLLEWRSVAVFVVVTLLLFVIGFSVGSSALVGLVGVAVLATARRLDVGDDPQFDRENVDRRHGVRGDLQDLTWAMTGRDGRIGERVLRRLRLVASARLHRHGLRLDDPGDEAAIRAALDDRAWWTLTRTKSPLPTVHDVRHTVNLLERLGPDPRRPA
jgi:hypothetical protein